MFSSPYLQLIDKLLPAMPHPSLDQFFFWNSGSEAVEASIKLARQATGKQNIICFQGAYHGRTMGSGAVTRSKPIYTQGTGPLMVSSTVAYIHTALAEITAWRVHYSLPLLARARCSPFHFRRRDCQARRAPIGHDVQTASRAKGCSSHPHRACSRRRVSTTPLRSCVQR